jgi:hypothetical protein
MNNQIDIINIKTQYSYLSKDEIRKKISDHVVDTAWNIKDNDDKNERMFKIQYIFEMKRKKPKKTNIVKWKQKNYKLLNKNEKKYFNFLVSDLTN